MDRDWIYQHAGCLRERDQLDRRPGGFAVIVQEQLSTRLSQDQPWLTLGRGRTLFSEETTNVEEAIVRHLHGTVYESDLRLGVALLIRLSGREPSGTWSDRERERCVDDWLDANTAIAAGRLPAAMMAADIAAPLNSLWSLRARVFG